MKSFMENIFCIVFFIGVYTIIRFTPEEFLKEHAYFIGVLVSFIIISFSIYMSERNK
jgi:predicted transporter